MLYVIIETFRGGDAAPVYRRLRDQGRGLPDGVRYISSWVRDDLSGCFQLMESVELDALEAWMAQWSDLVDFDVVPVLTSEAAAARVADLS